MDFRGWKKVCEDGKTCTLEHPKGHKLMVALRGLSSVHREQIRHLKLAEGGEVKKNAHPNTGKQIPQEAIDLSNRAAMDVNAKWKSAYPNGETAHSEHKKLRKNYDDGGAVAANDQSSDDQGPNGNNHTFITINAAPAPGGAAAPQQTAPQSPANPAAQLARAPLQVVPPAPVQGIPNILPNGQPNPSAISKNAQLIPEAQKDIDIAQAKGEAQNLGQTNEALGQSMEDYQNRYNDLSGHVKDFADYMQKNPIDPKHYQENMGSGAKVATALGLFFGGLGVPFGGHNYAQDFLNKQIDRDIEAQKSKAEQQKTIYGAYKELYGEGKEALAATKATMLDIANNRQKLIAAQLGTPQAYQKSLALSNQLAIDKGKALREGAAPLNVLPGFNPNTGASGAPKNGMKPINNNMGNAKPGGQAPPAAASEHILVPGSSKMIPNLQYNPQTSGMVPAILEQHAKADLADKAIDTINQYFPQTVATAQSGAGYLHRKAQSLANAPLIGPEIAAAGNTIFDTQNTRDYDRAYSAIVGAVRGALQGNVGEELLDRTVKANTPELDDTPDLIKKKMSTLKEFIKSHTKTDLLRAARLSKE